MRSWLKDLRENAGMTQSDLAQELGITRQYYSFIELGKRQPTLSYPLMVALGKIFKLKIKKIAELDAARGE